MNIFTSLSPAKPTIVFDTYWKFAAERQAIFFRRFHQQKAPWTDDTILSKHKFTNAYRASDRVSQYMIRNVIYSGEQSLNEVFFRTILFKLFNKIETWKLLNRELGSLTFSEFKLERYDRVLSRAMASGQAIYSGAYIMPSGGAGFRALKKHQGHLRLLDHLIREAVPARIGDSRCMRDAFLLLRSYPMMGDFLAYQYIIDLNYSGICNFSESDFVIPGPGAKDGIRKCFKDCGGLTEAEIIKVMFDRQDAEFERLGLKFQKLWGRSLQLIDCQNLFCEVDKYARIKHPNIIGITGRTRIKQAFRPSLEPIEYWYPPKWNLLQSVQNDKTCNLSQACKSHRILPSKGESEMDMRFYQEEAQKMDTVPDKIIIPLLGLAGETGSLLTEYKKHMREGDSYRIFDERIEEELGDILWYVANIATKAKLDLAEIAAKNLKKVRGRWKSDEEEKELLPGIRTRLFDEEAPTQERLPRQFTAKFHEHKSKGKTYVEVQVNSIKLGDRLTDNLERDDGYRFHDVFHLAYAAVLGWSPVTRKNLHRKRKSNELIDEVEDGGRAAVLEEAVSALAFDYAKMHSFFENVSRVDYELLSKIKSLTSHLEVSRCTVSQWEKAILDGYRVWRQFRHYGGGTLVGNLNERTFLFKCP